MWRREERGGKEKEGRKEKRGALLEVLLPAASPYYCRSPSNSEKGREGGKRHYSSRKGEGKERGGPEFPDNRA